MLARARVAAHQQPPVHAPTGTDPLDETGARQVVLVQAFDDADGPLWTAQDRDWASRVASETAGTDASAAQFLTQRAHHALQRLHPRDAGIGRWLARRAWRPAWLLAVLAAGGLAGALGDSIGASQHINLLAPPVWAVIAWNLLVYAGLAVQALRKPAARASALRRGLLRIGAGRSKGSPPLQSASAAWARVSAPLALARLAILLHGAAAALALGLIAGLYVRGLVLDYRAGWQSTFLDAGTVQALLAALLAPAVALTGIGVPDAVAIDAMRIVPGLPPSASAAPWIHLMATLLVLVVVLPRTLLALAAAWRVWRLARRFPLAIDTPYFQQLLRRQRGGVARVQVLPHAAAAGAQAVLGLRAALARVLGDDVQLQLAAVTAFGDEEGAECIAADAGLALRVALVDLGATPEAEVHGRFVQALRRSSAPPPLLLVADETAFHRRFGTLPERLAERREAWQKFADAQGVALLCADLDAPDLPAADRALKDALST